MALELIVEDGTGLPDSNSFASLEEFNAYLEAHLYPGPAATADNALKEKALVHSTNVICAHFAFDGSRVTSTQALPFPRNGIINRERSRTVADDEYTLAVMAGLGGRLGMYYSYSELVPNNIVPPRVKAATCEQARLLLEKNRLAESPTAGIQSFSIGQGALSFHFDKTDRPGIFTDGVKALLAPFARPQATKPAFIPLVR